LASKLTELYKKYGIVLRDVLCWENKTIPSEPKISLHKAGTGKKIIRKQRLKGGYKKDAKSKLIKAFTYILLTVGIIFMAIGCYMIWNAYTNWLDYPMLREQFQEDFIAYFTLRFIEIGTMTFLPAGMMLIFLVLIIVLARFGGGGNMQGISGSSQSEMPKLIVDNSNKCAPFIDATGHKSPQLYGSIAWDPYQTGGLGTPEHQRTTAGDCHKANMGILYIDEIKNLHPEEAITLLTVLEEGQLPITLRSRWAAGGTAAMAVSTEPVPCLTFLVAAGNFDSIQLIHHALMDRIYGYGKVVRMNNDMQNTIKNRRKYIQFIAQETKRFRFPPFSRKACEEIIAEGRRKCGKRNRLSTKFRPLISIIKTAATLALNDKSKFVLRKHVIETTTEHCKTIQKQLLEQHIEERGELLEIHPEGNKIGSIYGLAVVKDMHSHEMTGTVLQVKGCITDKNKVSKKAEGYFDVTGITKKEGGSWISDSISKVRMVIIQKYGIDIAQSYFTHIDFAQAYGVDGPSAGVTMTLLLCSLIDKEKIRQDVAVTGEINIAINGKIQITAVGGVHEKIKAAEAWGFKKVVIPSRNLEKSINPKDYKIKVVGAETLEEYLKEVIVDE